ncbi:hypothetical protein [Catenovulum agarivorans]|uniref:hypothetical protein n=1 Tax=Catenovulum agarivorans TaxID=1172192 RepID=UPI0003153830|nr:hypothetical protein [Catenovulum agarivorans]
MHFNRRTIWQFLAVGSLLFILSVVRSYWSVHQQVTAAIHQSYLLSNTTLVTPDLLINLEQQLNNSKAFTFTHPIFSSVIRQVSIKQASSVLLEDSASSWFNLAVVTNLAEHRIKTRFDLAYQVSWLSLLLFTLLVCLSLNLLVAAFPNARKQKLITWRNRLQTIGLSKSQAKLIANKLSASSVATQQQCQWIMAQNSVDERTWLLEHLLNTQLKPEQFSWLQLALSKNICAKQALNIATATDELTIDLTNSQVTIHGIPCQLKITPLIYYYWYAQKQKDNLGAYINPAINKPDREQGQYLAELMQQYGGHKKAINDLLENGLKGKTLDQNRNKIKEELTQQLGDLAENYLFDSRRDGRTARYQYWLKLPAEKITLKV